MATATGPDPGPSLVRGTRHTEGQPRIITDTDRAAHDPCFQASKEPFCRLQRRGQLASDALVGTAKLAGLGSSVHARPYPLLAQPVHPDAQGPEIG
jgi:hypothetical protein